MDGALLFWLYVISVGGLAIGGAGSIIMFFLVLFRLVEV